MTEPTSGTMISTFGSLPAAIRSLAASATARTCNANRPGVSRPSRTPRSPSIGFDSCSFSTAASSLRSASTLSPVSPRASATATLTASSVRSGRNSCSGGSSRRMFTGKSVHRVEQFGEVLTLQRQQGGQRVIAFFRGPGQDDPLDQ